VQINPLNYFSRLFHRLKKSVKKRKDKLTGFLFIQINKNKERQRILECLPSSLAFHPTPFNLKITIIVPVYKGLEETKNCINSLLANSRDMKADILVINDKSPEVELTKWLEEIAAQGKIKLVFNEINLGFIKTINNGVKLCDDRDIIILNNDTKVPSGWIRRLAAHAYSGSKVGTVTPFSNNATINSWPTPNGGDMMPINKSLEEIDEVFKVSNRGRSINIPTGIGFCMYIRRACLDSVGEFNHEKFGLGYGEEVDFCMRASILGWVHLHACDLFVKHLGETSFGKDSTSRKNSEKTLNDLYPHFNSLLHEHINLNEVGPFKISALAAHFNSSSQPAVLLISHTWGGGTARHVDELAKGLASKINFILLQPKDKGFILSAPNLANLSMEIRNVEENLDNVIRLLEKFNFSRIHIHHWIDCENSFPTLRQLVSRLNVPFDFTCHDYMTICPRIDLISAKTGTYCNEPTSDGCNLCLNAKPRNLFGACDIDQWRDKNRWVLIEAQRVICPSKDVRERLVKYAPAANFIIVPHELSTDNSRRVLAPKLVLNQKLRIGLIGGLSISKGFNQLKDALHRWYGDEFEFYIIGHTCRPIAHKNIVHITGKYEEADLTDLIKGANLHVVWFPAIWPETYSYTLSAAIDAGLPIVASSIGAFPERLDRRPLTWLVADFNDTLAWKQVFHSVYESLLSPKIIKNEAGEISETVYFYRSAYLEPFSKRHF